MTALAPYCRLLPISAARTPVWRWPVAPQVDASSVERYRNAEHEGLASVIAAYLDLRGITDAQIGGVCVAGAGPVRDGVVQLTNLDWRIDRNALGQRSDR
jgi:glucokinase